MVGLFNVCWWKTYCVNWENRRWNSLARSLDKFRQEHEVIVGMCARIVHLILSQRCPGWILGNKDVPSQSCWWTVNLKLNIKKGWVSTFCYKNTCTLYSKYTRYWSICSGVDKLTHWQWHTCESDELADCNTLQSRVQSAKIICTCHNKTL